MEICAYDNFPLSNTHTHTHIDPLRFIMKKA